MSTTFGILVQSCLFLLHQIPFQMQPQRRFISLAGIEPVTFYPPRKCVIIFKNKGKDKTIYTNRLIQVHSRLIQKPESPNSQLEFSSNCLYDKTGT